MRLEDHPNPSQRWYHRRIHSYATLAGALAFPFMAAYLGIPEWVGWPFYAYCGSVWAVYGGGSVWESIKINAN
mgnify:CR=1 FL=1